jgi:hypothetical protein
VVFVEKAELGEFDEVFYVLPASFNELSAEYPSYVRPPEAINSWRMNIFLGV